MDYLVGRTIFSLPIYEESFLVGRNMKKVDFELRNVSFSFKRRCVLENISLKLEGGFFYALLGPNGSGKTTLLSLISGLLHPQQGEILLSGRNLKEMSLKEIARLVALVPQDFFIRFPYTVYQAALTGRFPYSQTKWDYSLEDYQLVGKYLQEGNIFHLADSLVTSLSGGEAQKLAFVRALVREAPVLLLDESVSNIDVASTLSFLKKASSWSREGNLVVGAFHDLNLASLFADRIIFVEQGQVELWENKKEALRPQNISRVFGIETEVYESSDGNLYLLYKTKEE